ncbi:hypothetical protein [Lunatimonas salinarum]|uniref:hypothetical protein n=1 Tax=Lunatimonas salinarum TaxID=1774590 RepID=UPI001AE08AAD|nr:hypothetical protein [Lunatimonas salinarum]
MKFFRIVIFMLWAIVVGVYSALAGQSALQEEVLVRRNADVVGKHPRGLILAEEVPTLRKRLSSGRYAGVAEALEREVNQLLFTLDSASIVAAEPLALSAEKLAVLYLFTGNERFAERAFHQLELLFEDEIIVKDPFSRGLTRAAVLRSVAIAYDFCFTGWTQPWRNQVNAELLKLIFNTQANMGREANYSLVSNWMGVRWGAVLLGGMVWDNPDSEQPSPIDPLVWDATKRLADHTQVNIYPQGWNAESIGYHIYNWSFIGPALIAFQNRRSHLSDGLKLLAPHALGSLKAMGAAMVSIPARAGLIGMKPDLSDDNLNLGTGLFGMAFRLYPQEQQATIKWMHDYLGDSSLYSVLYYPEDLVAENPTESNWLSQVDTTQGVVVFRNKFADSRDVVAAFNTSSKRIAGHKGPDVNTFRIIGGGAPLVIGGGRTNKIAGQTNLFTEKPASAGAGSPDPGRLEKYGFFQGGSGYAVGVGSSTGVVGHRRKFTANYDPRSGAVAVFLVEDQSENGQVWRLATPEFNQIKVHDSGYTILAPTGYALHVFALDGAVESAVSQELVPYGGSLSRVNPGIIWNNERYTHGKVIDFAMKQNLTVLLVLTGPNEALPSIERIPETNGIRVGGLKLKLEN